MQLQRLQELLQNPELISGEDRNGLIAWSEKYPYAAAISMLLARASSEGGHMNSEQDLLRAASHGTFRQPLFDLMLRTRLREEAAEVDELVDAFDLPDAGDSEGFVPDEGAEQRILDPSNPLEREALISAIGRTIENEVEEWNEDQDDHGFPKDGRRGHHADSEGRGLSVRQLASTARFRCGIWRID